MLSGNEIRRQVELGGIVIEPFCEEQLNPNSYNCRLGKEILMLTEETLDLHIAPAFEIQHIGEEGFLLRKGNVYLASTLECIGSKLFIPCIDGRSTIGRYGVVVHKTAGFGDAGFNGTFTLELQAHHRDTRVHYGDLIAQVSFHAIDGLPPTLYSGSYQWQTGPRAPKNLRAWK